MKKTLFKSSKLAIFFYIMAILSMCYTMYTVYASYDYIAGLVKEGSITWGSSIGDIIPYFVNNSSSYLFYTIAFIFFGYNSYKVDATTKEERIVDEEVIEDNEQVDCSSLETMDEEVNKHIEEPQMETVMEEVIQPIEEPQIEVVKEQVEEE